MISSTCIPLSLTLGGNSRQQIHGSAPSVMVLSLKVACHSMHPKGKPFPHQLGRAIAANFPHLPRRLSQATREPSSDTTRRINGPYKGGGLNMGLLFQFLKQQRDLNLSTSVAHLKEFFSTTKAH
jgi:hypothetical protein